MSKSARSRGPKEVESVEEAVQRPLPLVEVLVNAQRGLHDLLVDTGMQVLEAMLKEEQAALCGPRYEHSEDRKAYRHGSEDGLLTLGGRKVRVKKPRVRSVEGKELTLPSWEVFSEEDPMVRRVLEQVCIGVPMRKYERSLEDLPSGVETVAAKKSSVSRRFVAKSKAAVADYLGRSLEHLDLPIVMLDGTYLGDHLLLVALGIDSEGKKHVLGIREGGTESFEVCKSLLRELIDRGLVVEKPRLFVIDGSKGLHKAIRTLFRGWFQIQRCQLHKMRNVLEHLPERRRGWVRTTLRTAFHSEDAEKGRRRACKLISDLQEDHPGAAASIEEGLSEMFTVTRLGVHGALWRTLRTTNPIENLQGSLQYTAKNVKRWRSGMMALRWAVTGAMEAEKKFRRVRGYKQIPSLISALDERLAEVRNEEIPETKKKVA